jgi:ABC-type transport system involved in multi-copper enzyme maturation permease subunit
MSYPAPTLARLVQVELRKSIDTRAGRWLIGLLALVSVGGVVLLLCVGHHDDKNFSGFLFTAQLPMALLLPVLGILSMTGEWSQRTALATYALVPKRGRVFAAKLLGLVSLALSLVTASIVTAALATLIARATGAGGWDSVPNTVGRVLLFEVLVVIVGAGFGLALLNAPAALVGFFLLPSLLTALVSLISSLKNPVGYLNLVGNTTHLLGDDLTARIWLRLVVSIVVWGVVPLVVGALRVQRRDIS